MAIEDDGRPLFNGYLFIYLIVVCVVSECQFLVSKVAGGLSFQGSANVSTLKSTPSEHLYSNTQLECYSPSIFSIFSAPPETGTGETIKYS